MTDLMNRERRSFYSDWISQSCHDQRSLFHKANSLLSLRQEQALSPHDDKVHQFKELSEEEIVSFVASAPNKSCTLGPIPTSLVKSSLPILAPILTKIVNSSLSTSHIPSPWKRAIFLPKLKKLNLDPIFSNYRPLSNLYFIFKLTERAASIQIVDHLTLHYLFPVMQSTYRKQHSKETAFLKLMNDILLSMNRQQVSLLVLLDLILRHRRPYHLTQSSPVSFRYM